MDAPGAPERIGPYRLLRPLGEGGMGVVHLVEQEHPVRRQLALKVIRLGMASTAVVARFAQERQALARMQHDGIARVYDCGTTAQGQPYFVMELVDGLPIDRFCDQQQLGVRERLRLFTQVCAAVQHAHQKGVVHRDLKPSNVLVVRGDRGPQAKVIDFGLAKALQEPLDDEALPTERGQVLGTPEFMAPEQTDLGTGAVDTRADVYSLGVMLYQTLCGALPFSRRDLPGHSVTELYRLVREAEPVLPSARLARLGERLAAVAAARQSSPAALARLLRRDLDWLVHKALAKDPEQRYASASELQAELERWLADEPLLAGPPRAWYRLQKLLRRHRREVAAAAAVVLTALAGAGVAIGYARRASAARTDAETQAQAARQFAAQLDATVQDFELLAGVVHHDRARAAAAALPPPWPRHLPALREWLAQRAAPLLAMPPRLEAALAALAAPAARGNPEARAFLRDALQDLQRRLAGFAAVEVPAVQRQVAWAERLAALGPRHPGARHDLAPVLDALARGVGPYRDAPLAVAAPAFAGLVPLGPNPATGLFEFYDLRSAWDGRSDPADLPIPQHRPDGSLPIDDDSGLVFVLVPGGTVRLGAQRQDPAAPHHDPLAQDDEAVHSAALQPFLLSRYELTQGQWQRLWLGEPAGQAPSRYFAGQQVAGQRITWRHPVEQVDWLSASQLLRAHGLELPTEAQWEHACRAGTSTPWWPGADAADLAGAANVLDQSAARLAPEWGTPESFDDGFVLHAPVGSFRANPWGFHDLHGNVYEWCRDRYGSYAEPGAPGDGERQLGNGPVQTDRCNRGGSFDTPAASGRCAERSNNPERGAGGAQGGRPARRLAGGG